MDVCVVMYAALLVWILMVVCECIHVRASLYVWVAVYTCIHGCNSRVDVCKSTHECVYPCLNVC